jgi:hypothetical protein
MSMIKCINGHEQSETAALHLKCAVCGGLILYKEVCVQELPNLPKTQLTFEKISIIFAGLPKPASLPFDSRKVFVSSISLGDDELEHEEDFALRRTDASSWLDFYMKYLDKLGRWMKFVGIDRSDYRLLIIDTRKPISVLVLAAIQKSWRNTVVLGIIADHTSTLIEQNTSYVAIWTALKQGLPLIAVSTSYVDELIFYTEKGGLVVRSNALIPIIDHMVQAIDNIMDVLGNDARLGIKEHCLSAIFSATEKVYPSIESALFAQESSFSINAKKQDVATICLLAFAPTDATIRIDKAFTKYRREELKDLVGADHQIFPRDEGATSSLYDLVLIYGVKDGLTYEPLKNGYDSVASKVQELSLEKVV